MMRLFSKYQSAHEVQRQWKHYFNTPPPALATTTAVNQRCNKTGSLEGLPHTGRLATALTEKLEEIQDMVDTNPQLSIRQGSIRADISTNQYHAAMRKLQLKSYHPTLVVDLNRDDFDGRSQSSEICLKKFNYDSGLADHILCSNECKFNRIGTVNDHNCTYWPTENLHAKFTVPNTEERIMM